MSPVNTFYSEVGVDPTKFLMDDMKGKSRARWLKRQKFGSFGLEGWVEKVLNFFGSKKLSKVMDSPLEEQN